MYYRCTTINLLYEIAVCSLMETFIYCECIKLILEWGTSSSYQQFRWTNHSMLTLWICPRMTTCGRVVVTSMIRSLENRKRVLTGVLATSRATRNLWDHAIPHCGGITANPDAIQLVMSVDSHGRRCDIERDPGTRSQWWVGCNRWSHVGTTWTLWSSYCFC